MGVLIAVVTIARIVTNQPQTYEEQVAAAIMMSFLQKENLVKAMVDGKKQGLPDQGIRYPQYVVGVLLIVASGCIFYLVISSSLPALTQ